MKPCKIWGGCKNHTRGGYGLRMYKGKVRQVHRLAYEEAYGPIPEGMLVCHSCDEPACYEPEHLWLGTDEDNKADMFAKGRNAKGERHGNAKLTDADVLDIRQRYVPRVVTLQMLANEYGVDQSLIHQVVKHKGWKHV